MVALKVLLLYFGLFGTLAEKLPMVTDFVFDIVNYYQSKNIIFHISHEDIHPYTTRLMRKISLEGRYFTIYSINDCECNVTREIIDMHFVMFDSNVKCVECEFQSNPNVNDYVLDCFRHRQRFHREPWIFYTNIGIQDVLNELETASFDLDDDVLVAQDFKNESIELWEIYKISNSSGTQFNKVGSWSVTDGLKMTTVHKWYRRKNLQQHHFLTTTLAENPFTTKFELNPLTGKYEIEGSFADLLFLLGEVMNFTFTIEPPPDNKWGGLQSDGSWNGMMNLVQKQLVDFAPTSLIQTVERQLATDWTLPLVFSHLSIFIKNPTNTYNYTAFLEPLTYASWVAILVFLLSVPFVIFFIAKSSDDDEVADLPESFGAVYVALLLLGSTLEPIKIPTRIVFLSILLCAALLFWHWEAMLVSYLATRKTVMPFTTVTDMYLSTNFRLALIPSTTFEDNFKYSKEPLWQEIYKERIQPYLTEYSSYENYLSDMVYFIREDTSTALIDGYIPISSTKDYQDCNIVVTEGKYFKRPYAWTFQKHSPYLDIFNFYITELNQKGQWNAIINKYQAQPQVCPDLSGMPIEFANCFTAFLCLVGGLLLGLFLFLLEFLLKPCPFMPYLLRKNEKVEELTNEELKRKVLKLSITVDRLRHELYMSNWRTNWKSQQSNFLDSRIY